MDEVIAMPRLRRTLVRPCPLCGKHIRRGKFITYLRRRTHPECVAAAIGLPEGGVVARLMGALS